MPQIVVPLSTAAEIVALVLDVPPDGIEALRARMRHMTDLGVPTAGRGKAHQRLRYGLVELTEMSVALLLANTGMPQSTAARYVRERWMDLAPVAVFGIGDLVPAGYERRHRPRAAGAFAVIEGNVLKQLGKRGVREGAGDLPLAGVADVAGETPLESAALGMSSSLVLNASVFMPVIVAALLKHAEAKEDLRDSVDALRLSEKRLDQA